MYKGVRKGDKSRVTARTVWFGVGGEERRARFRHRFGGQRIHESERSRARTCDRGREFPERAGGTVFAKLFAAARADRDD